MPQASVVLIGPLLPHSYGEVWPPWYSVNRERNNRVAEIAARKYGSSEHGFTVHNPFRYWLYISRHYGTRENRCTRPLVKSLRVGSNPIRVNDYVVIGPDDVVPLSGVYRTVAGPREAALQLEFAAHRQPIGKGCDHLVGMIRTIIVDDYDLPIEMIRYPQRGQRSQCPSQRFGSVERADRNCWEHPGSS